MVAKVLVDSVWQPITLTNHPGHANQKVHGRRRGGAADLEVRDALAGTGSIRELNAVAGAEAKRITGRDITFDMAGSDLQTAREHCEGVLRGLERFPNARVREVNVARIDTNAWAQTGMLSGRITFNSEYSSPAGREKYLKGLAEGAAGWDKGLQTYGISDRKISSFHTRNSDSPIAVALHEFGHTVDSPSGKNHSAVENLIRRETAREQRSQTLPGTKINHAGDLVQRTVSGYAMKNTTELVAEAFTDVMVNGSDASTVSKGIFQILEEGHSS